MGATSTGTAKRAERAIWTFALACLACFCVLVTWVLVQSYNDSTSRAETRVRTYSQVVSANAALLMEASYQALRRIDVAVGGLLENPSPDAGSDLNTAVANLPRNARAWVIDATGKPVLSNTTLPEAFSVADRDYFLGLKAGDLFRISPLMESRAAGDKVFAVAKRIERGGQFVGAAVIVLPANYLDQFRGALELGRDSTISLLRADGMLVTRSPVPDEATDLSNYILFTDYLTVSDEGSYVATSPTDGVDRIVGYRRVPDYPLVAIASVSLSEAMASFWQTLALVAAFGIPGLIGLGTFALWTVRSQRELARALDDNQTLFREIHHRVKNNLQQVSALINLQPISADIRNEMSRRIGAMVAVHEHMYRSDHYATISAADALPKLIDDVRESFARPVEIETSIAPISIDRDQALPLALIVNEVIANAIKHAFPDDRAGTIEVTLEPLADGRARLVVKDDGIGFDPAQKSDGTGNRLIRGLVAQLQGEMRYEFDGGTRFVLDFDTQANRNGEGAQAS